MGNDTGIIYNNELDDFSFVDQLSENGSSTANLIGRGKRPVSSQSPLIVVDRHGTVRLILGASGSKKILSSVAQVALLNLLFKRNIKEAIDQARLHHHLHPNEILFEQSFDQVSSSLSLSLSPMARRRLSLVLSSRTSFGI